jgi:WD40 repeat protein
MLLRDVASGKVVGRGTPDNDCPRCTCIAFSPNGEWVASVHFVRQRILSPHVVHLWEVATDHRVRKRMTLLQAKDQTDAYEAVHFLAFSPDGKLLATRLPDDTTVVWETATGRERLRQDVNGLTVAFAADGRTLISVSRTGDVQH